MGYVLKRLALGMARQFPLAFLPPIGYFFTVGFA